ncbi:MAG: putative sulfate exporter family transporter [Planctomycetota bacterium]
MQKRKFFEMIPGVVLTVIVGYCACWIAEFHKGIDSLVVGVVLGIVIGTFVGRRPFFLPGFGLAMKIFISIGIMLYGINLEFHKLAEIPAAFWLQLIVGIIAIFLVALYLGRKLSASGEMSLLIATGTAICGASAIAIAAPIVKAESEDTGISLLTITIFGLFGILIYPLALTFFALSDTQYAFLCATTLPQTGFVKIASLALGESCLKLAISIKVARTAMIIPVIGFLCWYMNRRTNLIEGERKKFFLYQVPWFVWIFVLVGILVSLSPAFAPLTKTLKPWAGIFLTMALTSIGLTVDLKQMYNFGVAPLIAGLACWLVAIGVFILGNLIF